MNTKSLANHYSQLTREERFRLVVAAVDRGDEAERERVKNASKRITLSTVDYSPFAEAFQELAQLVFIDLVEEGALFRCAFERWCDADLTSFLDGKKSASGKAKKNPLTHKERTFHLWLAQGYMLRSKAAGWKIFCDRMGASPNHLWSGLPGFDRLQRDLNLVEGTSDPPGPAFSQIGMVRWMNSVRPPGKPEATEATILTAEGWAKSIEALFRELVEWNGG